MMFEGRMALFIEAMHADMEIVSKPVSTVKNAFHKFIGHDVEEAPEPTKERKYLDELVEKNKNEKTEKRKMKKAERSERIATWLDNHLPKRKAKDNKTEKESEEITLCTTADSSEE